MRDVPAESVLDAPNSAFRNSRWHQRGWTLQELIAPHFLVFFSRDWRMIGTETDLSHLLQEITAIPNTLLRELVGLSDIPVAKRMSWAAKRKTTRVEDQAYCLMGIFGINMPTLYGEGRQAFLRLQGEIMRHYPDTTLFAWGSWFLGHLDQLPPIDDPHNECSYLSASSPAAFKDYVGTSLLPPDPQPFGSMSEDDGEMAGNSESLAVERRSVTPHTHVLSLTITPYGVLAKLPVIKVKGVTIAVLFWVRRNQHLGLIIAPCPRWTHAHLSYDIGVGDAPHYRLISLGHHKGKFKLFGEAVPARWSEIYLSHRPPPGVRSNAVSTLPIIPMCLRTSAPFRFRERSIERILKDFDLLRFWPDRYPLE